jgi:hypothetical protein
MSDNERELQLIEEEERNYNGQQKLKGLGRGRGQDLKRIESLTDETQLTGNLNITDRTIRSIGSSTSYSSNTGGKA